MKKIIMAAALLLGLAMCLSACSSYRNDVPVNDVASEILAVVSTQGGFSAADSDYVALEFADPGVIDSNVSEWIICASTSSSTVDEFGIFHVKEGGDVNAVKNAVWDYVQTLQVKLEVYLDMYDPAEKDKLENAKLTVYGNYIVYTMLSSEDTTATHTAVLLALRQQ